MNIALPLPEVLSHTELSNSFLGNMLQVCVVTRDHRRILEGFVKFGIGPWTIRTVDGDNVKAIYRGRPADFSVKVCLANSQNMNWEVIEPIRGQSIYADFLEQHGEGVQHLAFSCNGMDYNDRVREFASRGCTAIQHGVLFNGIEFHYFATGDDLQTTLEVYRVPPGFTFPEPDAWYPAPPPA
jgi:methylmalonyl-CoA/ethylmalonyl-CoA epimerase